jgi:hypothetical protein
MVRASIFDGRMAPGAHRPPMHVHAAASTTTIGEAPGFAWPTHSLKFFKRVGGMTPDALRKSWRPAARRPAAPPHQPTRLCPRRHNRRLQSTNVRGGDG